MGYTIGMVNFVFMNIFIFFTSQTQHLQEYNHTLENKLFSLQYFKLKIFGSQNILHQNKCSPKLAKDDLNYHFI